jgi:Thymidylate synthase complementing protein
VKELKLVIPEFLQRIDRPDRGGIWIDYLKRTRQQIARNTNELIREVASEHRPEVVLTDFDPEAETKIVAAILYETSTASDDQLLALARSLTPAERQTMIATYVGVRGNRRHKPGRAFERTMYRFDVLADYGAFRDLQRHRMLTIEWQSLSPNHGYVVPAAIEEAGFRAEWERAMDQSGELYEALLSANLSSVAPYAVLMAYRIRFYMQMNAREAMHIIELRTSPQGHPNYRRICQAMHDLIRETAGHHGIAAAMSFVDHSAVDLGRLDSEHAVERRKTESDRRDS